MDNIKRIIEKLTSGRFVLTVITGMVFAYAVKYKILNAETTAAIIVMVFINYFQKDKDKEEQK